MVRHCLFPARIIGERFDRDIELDEGYQLFRKSCGAVKDLDQRQGGVAKQRELKSSAANRLSSGNEATGHQSAGVASESAEETETVPCQSSPIHRHPSCIRQGYTVSLAGFFEMSPVCS
jgi:hypothetical protein